MGVGVWGQTARTGVRLGGVVETKCGGKFL